MNDRHNPYDPYALDPYTQPQPEIIGYDAYGQPVYQQTAPPEQHDPYGHLPPQSPQPEGYGYDPYAQQPQQPAPFDPYAQQASPQQATPSHETYGYDTGGQQQPWAPQQSPLPEPQQARRPPRSAPAVSEEIPDAASRAEVPGQRRTEAPQYATEQFAFVEEPDDKSEDVIDWLKFTESRTERREEAKRRGRFRVVALAVALALVVVGGVGYLWYADKLPGLSSGKNDKPSAAGAQKRDVIALHLHNTEKPGMTSTVLLVDNVSTGQGTTVLLPNSLSLAGDNGVTTTLAKSVEDDGSAGTRESLGTALGTPIGGTWRLDTPYLEVLVDLVSTIDVDTDTVVPDAKKGATPLVSKGTQQTLTGRMAVAYATYRAPGEPETKQLARFGAVMHAVLKKISDDPQAATVTVQSLAQILDPSLPEKSLAVSLAKLAEHARKGAYQTVLLPVRPDGRVSESDTVVKTVLGGTATAPEQGAAVRVGVRNATGKPSATENARIALVNSGYAFTDTGNASTAAASGVSYADDAHKPKAEEVAKTLGLPASAVTKGQGAQNVEVSVVLGSDYKVPSPQ
ncbi:LCP family protein [Streptomyces candidus]|uniref:Anionic cell wall polymer biosynthesis LytR-Cps2A-Psr (LCP) family protein n=1 Tax=Streptomyces candidus TaxID=67283 RepID=A0A7X0HD71_9ACTN|nr:LCP family protein [Streptomyces candidus]MBB6434107.1 anionic cell wall polymer biosynthesis LytR-Cps2A-Psr (LCP) family protein [Streptomyces candidus]GHH33289.1 membrane protein [Streptomyces candidus]